MAHVVYLIVSFCEQFAVNSYTYKQVNLIQQVKNVSMQASCINIAIMLRHTLCLNY